VRRGVQRQQQRMVVAVVDRAAVRLVEQRAVGVHRDVAQRLPARQVQQALLRGRHQRDAVPVGDRAHAALRRGDQLAPGGVGELDRLPALRRQRGVFGAPRRGGVAGAGYGQHLGLREMHRAVVRCGGFAGGFNGMGAGQHGEAQGQAQQAQGGPRPRPRCPGRPGRPGPPGRPRPVRRVAEELSAGGGGWRFHRVAIMSAARPPHPLRAPSRAPPRSSPRSAGAAALTCPSLPRWRPTAAPG
jgi:hypothetical protein